MLVSAMSMRCRTAVDFVLTVGDFMVVVSDRIPIFLRSSWISLRISPCRR